MPDQTITIDPERLAARRHITNEPVEIENLLTPAEVAQAFRVDPKTVTRWAKAGRLPFVRTLGGHRRYREADVRALRDGAEATSS